jgi:hypothetical protein
LRGWKPWVAGLRNRGFKYVQDARILAAGDAPEPFIELLRILFRKVRDLADSQQLEIPQHGGPDGDQILQFPMVLVHVALLDNSPLPY